MQRGAPEVSSGRPLPERAKGRGAVCTSNEEQAKPQAAARNGAAAKFTDSSPNLDVRCGRPLERGPRSTSLRDPLDLLEVLLDVLAGLQGLSAAQ